VASVYKVILDAQDKTAQAFSKLERNLDKAQKATDRVKKSLGGMTGAIGVAAGAAGFGALAKSSLEAADNLAKTADRLGITAAELNSLQLAANFAGVETKDFNKLMEIFQKRIGEAAEGTGQAKDALQKFGIDAEKLAKLPLDKQLAIIADEFVNFETAAEDSATASDLFSNRGIKLVNMLKGGSAGLREASTEFTRLGLAIEDDSLDQIEAFNDSMTKVQGIIQAAMIKGLADAAPEMERFAERAAEMAVPLVGDLLDGITFLLENMGAVTAAIKGFFGVIVVTKLTTLGAAMIALFGAASAPFVIAAVAVAAVTTAVVLFYDELVALLKPLTDAGRAVGDFINKINPFSDDVDEAETAVRGLAAAEEVLEEMTGSAANELLVLRSAGNQVQDAADKATTPVNEFGEALERVNDAANPAAPAVEEFGDSTDETADEAMAAAVRTNEFADAIERLQKESRTGVDDVADLRKKIEEYQAAVDAGEASQDDLNRVLRRATEDIGGVTFAKENLLEEIQKVNSLLVLNRELYGENSEAVRLLKGRLEELTGEYLDAQDAANGLTKEHKDMLDRVKGLTPEVKKVHEEIKILNDLYVEGKISTKEFREQTDRLAESLKDTKGSATDAETALANLIGAMATGKDGNIGGFIEALIGKDGVKDAIEGCFGTGPVTSFDNAVRGLFPTFTEFEGVIGSLEGALGRFFAGGELKFSAFKDAILQTLADIAAGAVASVGINFLKNLIPGLASGGSVDGFAVGGSVSGPGGPREDKVLARLSAGEYVIQASSVSKFGKGFFDALNAGKLPGFAAGGLNSFDPGPIGSGGIDFGLPTNPIAAFLTIKNLLDFLIGAGSNEEFKAANRQLNKQKNDWISANVFGATDALVDTFGPALIDLMIPTISINPNTGLPEETRMSYPGAILEEIYRGTELPGGPSKSGVKRNIEILEGMAGLTDELAAFIFDYLAPKFASITIPEFNMDDVVERLFRDANGVAGGSLTLNAREFGGPLERGQASVVGEGGPELFVPGRGGTVTPIAQDGGNRLIEAVNEVREELSALRRQVDRQQPLAFAGGRR